MICEKVEAVNISPVELGLKMSPPDFVLDECDLEVNEEEAGMPCPAYNSCSCDHIACSVFMG